MNRIRKCYFWAIAGLVFAGGCKKSETNLTYYLTPILQEEQSGTGESTQLVVGYYFAVDSVDWMVASYENATTGVLTRKDDPDATISFRQQAESDEQGRLVFGPFTGEPVMLVIATVDPDDDPDDPRMRMYAWRTVEVLENLPELHVKMWFRPWKTTSDYKTAYYDSPDKYYTESNWKMFNQNPVAIPEPDPVEPDPEEPDPEEPDPIEP